MTEYATAPGYTVRGDYKPGWRRYQFRPPGGEWQGSAHSIDAAWHAAEKHYRKSLEKVRNCITCRREFLSSGPGHRMCPGCRERGEELIAV